MLDDSLSSFKKISDLRIIFAGCEKAAHQHVRYLTLRNHISDKIETKWNALLKTAGDAVSYNKATPQI